MSLRVTKPGPARRKANLNPDRPPIWVDGSQNPPFELGAFARASLARGKALATERLERMAGGAADLSRRSAEGTPPARRRLFRALAGTGTTLAQAARAIRGDGPGDTAHMTQLLARSFRPQAPASRPMAKADPRALSEDHDLALIRRILREDTTPPAPPVTAGTTARPRDPDAPSGGMARLVAIVAVVLFLPFGAAMALHAHLDGEDLRQTH